MENVFVDPTKAVFGFRILPYPKPFTRFGVHELNEKQLVCPQKTGRDSSYNYCPICEMASTLEYVTQNGRRDYLKSEIEQFKPRVRYLANVVLRKDHTIHVAEFPESVYRKIVDLLQKEPKLTLLQKLWRWFKSWFVYVPKPNIIDLESHGHSFYVRKTNQGYDVHLNDQPEPAGTSKQIRFWKKAAVDPVSFLKFHTHQEMTEEIKQRS